MAGLIQGNARGTEESQEPGSHGVSVRWVVVALGVGVVMANILYLMVEALRG